jgi:hypothetical protein
MRHGLYEDPITHKFAVIRLPSMFRDGDAVTKPPTPRWRPVTNLVAVRRLAFEFLAARQRSRLD